jgi:hypothetical protein
MDERWAEFERRLARAERQVRVLRGTGLLVLVALGATLASKAAVTQGVGSTVREPFTVIDGRGKPLLRVESYQARLGEWVPRIDILGTKGGPIAELTENEWGGSLEIRDKNKALRTAAALYASNAGGGLVLNDAAGKVGCSLDGWFGGNLHIRRVYISYGGDTLAAAVLAPVGDGALLVIRDTAGNEVARLGATGKGGLLTLRNKARDDAARKELVTLSATARGGSLTLRAPAGHPVFHRP